MPDKILQLIEVDMLPNSSKSVELSEENENLDIHYCFIRIIKIIKT